MGKEEEKRKSWEEMLGEVRFDAQNSPGEKCHVSKYSKVLLT